jgi:aquaporin Z
VIAALRAHWREALIEGLLLGLFMVSAGLFATLLYAPDSPAAPALAWLPSRARDLAMGLAMGTTAVALIYSRLGQRSGAHMNWATTLTFLRLGKMAPWDAFWYAVAQPVGGALGVLAVAGLCGRAFTSPPVASVTTVPGPAGAGPAFLAEAAMAFGLMTVVLQLSNRERWRRYTGLAAGTLVLLYIALEAPISGMSINPARSLASAIPSGIWRDFWVDLTAPCLGMLLAAELYVRTRGIGAVLCAKLHHTDRHDCLFRCGWCRHPETASGIEGRNRGEPA